MMARIFPFILNVQEQLRESEASAAANATKAAAYEAAMEQTSAAETKLFKMEVEFAGGIFWICCSIGTQVKDRDSIYRCEHFRGVLVLSQQSIFARFFMCLKLNSRGCCRYV